MTTTSKLAGGKVKSNGPGAAASNLGWAFLREATSRRTTLALIALFLAALALQSLLPQQAATPPAQFFRWQAQYPLLAQAAQALGLTQVSGAPWFWALGFALAASLALCFTRRAVSLARRGPDPQGPEQVLSIPGPAGGRQEMAAVLRRRGYRVTFAGRGLLAATKGHLGPWGSVLFHGGMVVLFAGILMSAATWFRGFSELAPGQIFLEGRSYLAQRGGLLARQDASLSAVVLDMGIAFWPDESIKDIWLKLEAQEGEGPVVEGTVRRNQALEVGDSSLSLGSPFGPAVLLRYTPPGQSESRQGYVNFMVEGSASPRADFAVPGTAAEVEAELAGPWRAALAGTATAYPPVLRLKLQDGEGGLRSEELALGQSLPLAEGELSFVAVKPWVLFMVARDRGLPVIIAGGLLALAGLALALFIPPRRVKVSPAAYGWQLAGRTAWGTASFRKELEEIAASFKENSDA